ncbi:porin [Thioalkalivibrio sp. ALMg3]|uniref:porin n=1 Tax=Thioalkalivibrio sp. ALMg3 TaxID=1158163 RepID=UPI0003631264|nr:porin [Thioalkalivibrio sp. ALMg3]
MKKQILAVAVAGAFAVPAFAAADSNVTLFGQLQTQIVHHSGSNAGTFEDGFRQHDAGGLGNAADGSGPNRLGVMVNHDLGNGLTALAKLEGDFQTGTGRGEDDTSGFNSGNRDIYVGLDGNFGRVIAGRMSSSYSTAGKDPLNATFMQARANGARLGGDGGFGNGSYVDRGIRYSNSFGMVSLDLGVFLDNSNDSDTAFSGRLNFDLGAVDLYVAHVNADGYGSGPNVSGGDYANTKIGADWKSGPFRVVGEFEDADRGGNNQDFQTVFLSGTYSMGRNDFVLNIGMMDRDDNNDREYVALAVKHNFSNRVMAYAGVGYASQDNLGMDSAGNMNGSDISFTGVGGGMRVSF